MPKQSQILKQALNAKEKNGGGATHVTTGGTSQGNGGSLSPSGISGSGASGLNVPLAAAASEAPKE